jgi:hypothetical protein
VNDMDTDMREVWLLKVFVEKRPVVTVSDGLARNRNNK